ncbi:MAG: cobalamin-dependent protein, partial [Rhizobiales bacterium]|nr:cobalamin-dependent protein [Hyphomicrobiales bacterium]
GFEVIYTGLRKSPEEIALAARDAEVDVIGLSILSGSHMPICQDLKSQLEKYQLTNKVWVIGGNIPEEDHDALLEIGVEGVFNTGSKLNDIIAFIREKVSERAD